MWKSAERAGDLKSYIIGRLATSTFSKANLMRRDSRVENPKCTIGGTFVASKLRAAYDTYGSWEHAVLAVRGVDPAQLPEGGIVELFLTTDFSVHEGQDMKVSHNQHEL